MSVELHELVSWIVRKPGEGWRLHRLPDAGRNIEGAELPAYGAGSRRQEQPDACARTVRELFLRLGRVLGKTARIYEK
jgi:hypothetical protein